MSAGYILLTSIPHSGTQFFQAVFQPNRLAHFTSNRIDEFVKDADTIAVAVRHPALIWRSWYNRGKHVDGQPIGEFWRAWEKFGKYWDNPKFNYLPIDVSPARHEYFRAFARKLNRPVVPDFNQFIGDFKGPQSQAPEVDLSRCFEVPIIKRLYDGVLS